MLLRLGELSGIAQMTSGGGTEVMPQVGPLRPEFIGD
jgi:hypothetical protein